MTTTMSPPIDLPLPPPWPDPQPHCDVCGALAKQRADAARAGDYSTVTDCNVEIRNHRSPHQRRHS